MRCSFDIGHHSMKASGVSPAPRSPATTSARRRAGADGGSTSAGAQRRDDFFFAALDFLVLAARAFAALLRARARAAAVRFALLVRDRVTCVGLFQPTARSAR